MPVTVVQRQRLHGVTRPLRVTTVQSMHARVRCNNQKRPLNSCFTTNLWNSNHHDLDHNACFTCTSRQQHTRVEYLLNRLGNLDMAHRQICRSLTATQGRSCAPVSHVKSFLSTDPSPAQASRGAADDPNRNGSSSAFGLPRPKLAPAESIIRPKTSGQESYGASSVFSGLEMHKGEEQVTKPTVSESEQKATVEKEQARAVDGESKDDDHEDYVLDEYGKRRRRQRMEVEKGHFHEITAVNKNKG